MGKKTPSNPPKKNTARPRKAIAKKAKEPSLGSSLDFPIVGIGASAGGLEALEQFVQHVPRGCGMAFVVIQHLDPTRKGLMPELLQKATSMDVIQVQDRTKIHPDCVYVIPPNKDMSILHGVLHLFESTVSRGLRLPIDYFLRSLAQDRQQSSIGVILSGMGSDGTLGMREIKDKAGLTFAQDPASARFDSMPRSVIDAGLADVVDAADKLPARILSCLKRPPIASPADERVDPKTQSALDKILILLRSRSSHDFSGYKKNTLYRRIERRMAIHQIEKIATYVSYLQENPQELDLLFKELLIGVTSFFRDPAAWETLRSKILPELIKARSHGPFRAWVTGCSTGEEAYSLAIAIREAMDEVDPHKKDFKCQIFASDLDSDAIAKAREGVFVENIAADMSPERLRRFFVKVERGYRIRPEIRKMVVFSPHNLIMDPPFTKLDFLSCRNLLIYLTPEMQKRLFPIFHYSLKPGGVLMLGSAETVGSQTGLFTARDSKSRIFQRTESAVRPEPIDFPSKSSSLSGDTWNDSPAPSKGHHSLQSLAEQLILQRYAPATVLTDEKGNVVHISGRTGKYLEPAAGKANWNLFAMARQGLRYELTRAFQKTLHDEGRVVVKAVKIEESDSPQYADLTVEKIDSQEPLAGMVMVVFSETAAAPTRSKRRSKKSDAENPQVKELEQDLQRAHAELQSSREEMQSSQEELRSANEEMQSTNEEMQSTNEELTTSKEEMQSLNEELQTVNAELQGKLDELSRSNNDMKNLLNSTEVATLFLDNDLSVRRFTSPAAKIIKLIPSDVGRPITDLASELLYPELADDVNEVLRKLGSIEKSVRASDDRWFTARIMPYRTLDNRIEGVVITFWDITDAKRLEAELRRIQGELESRLADKTLETDQAKGELKASRARESKRDREPSRSKKAP
ncbi:chemotaxis protein CheB [Pelagicoccus sp. SDUM812003]|uniref:chemotaxis protein CheB n=1 Tax=Pelagicoccus sp. SDUM812003 TaxID=3041267 RepID=UPI00280D4C9D|nr:chemotaxis protein CheB [Pelagicoccus sp. SDUM812003]MDQ8204725.1 CheR family methyltransferase [Pelagicoccus sp. SDUM812003]